MRPRWLLSWGFRQLGATGRTSALMKLPDGRYVIVETVEVRSASECLVKWTNTVKKAASQILSHLNQGKPQVDRVYTMSMFRKNVTTTLSLKNEVTDTDLNIILKFLARDKRAIVYDREASTVFSLN